MSTITEQLELLLQTKSDIKSAIEDKGVTVGDVAFSQYAGKVSEITSSDTDTDTESGDIIVRFMNHEGVFKTKYISQGDTIDLSTITAPECERLTFTEWNYDQDDLTNIQNNLDVGAVYTTTSGNLEIDYSSIANGGMTPSISYLTTTGTYIKVYWGDGQETEGVSDDTFSPESPIENGDYTMEIESDGVMNFSNSGLYFNSASIFGLSDFRLCAKHIRLANIDSFSAPYLFFANSLLQSITIPDNILSTGYGTFQGCYNLKNIVIPKGATYIEDKSFNTCVSLQNVSIPKSVTYLGSYCFYGCMFQSIVIPSSVTAVYSYAFQDCYALRDITNLGLYSMSEDGLFCGCHSLQNIDIPNKSGRIGDYAFYECYALRSITIPNNITSIDTYALSKCMSLRVIDMSERTSIPSLSSSNCFSNSVIGKILVPAALYDNFTIATNWSSYASKMVAV